MLRKVYLIKNNIEELDLNWLPGTGMNVFYKENLELCKLQLISIYIRIKTFKFIILVPENVYWKAYDFFPFYYG